MAVALLVGLVGACASGGQNVDTLLDGPSNAASFELFPGVVADGRQPAVFLMRPGGGIEAVDPRTGGLIWSSGLAIRPLLVIDGQLVSQAEVADPNGTFPLVFLDAREGGRVTLRAEVPVPRYVRPLVDQGLGVSFSVSAWEEDGGVVVAWDYLERDAAGVAPQPGESPWRHRDAGAARVDVKTGQVTPLAGVAVPAVRPLPEKVKRLLDAGELRQSPWRVGPVLATTVDRSSDAGRRRVVLRRWHAETGEPLPEVVLLEDRPVARAPSADLRHLMVTSPLPGAGAERYLWSIFSLTTGERLGEVRRLTSVPPFCVFGHILLYQSQPFGRRIEGRWVEEPLKLRAIDLRNGTEVWSRLVRDTAYRGLLPPSR